MGNKDEFYLNIAREVAQKSTCIRRKFGTIIVNDNKIISTGWASTPSGIPHCIDIGFCERENLNIPSGEKYELCKSVHAEANAIIFAPREQMIGSTLYMYGENTKNKTVALSKPCVFCKRMIINAGISRIITKLPDGYHEIFVDDWKNP
ncbi:cytidine deaminase [archaeon]|jgi:dCMP deaminase|nr:cytidine deaminase [archaeon]MBT4417499.1 cytidine deaminase [archaeon]